jgi:hypothetical protein
MPMISNHHSGSTLLTLPLCGQRAALGQSRFADVLDSVGILSWALCRSRALEYLQSILNDSRSRKDVGGIQ